MKLRQACARVNHVFNVSKKRILPRICWCKILPVNIMKLYRVSLPVCRKAIQVKCTKKHDRRDKISLKRAKCQERETIIHRKSSPIDRNFKLKKQSPASHTTANPTDVAYSVPMDTVSYLSKVVGRASSTDRKEVSDKNVLSVLLKISGYVLVI